VIEKNTEGTKYIWTKGIYSSKELQKIRQWEASQFVLVC